MQFARSTSQLATNSDAIGLLVTSVAILASEGFRQPTVSSNDKGI